MRLLAIFVVLALVFTVPFLLWGDDITAERAAAWLRSYGDLAWAPAILVLVADLVLPVPATAVMSFLGLVYGTVIGGLVGAAGSFLAGCLAYFLCRFLGRGAAVRIAGARDLERGERLFREAGGWVVALSRWLPLVAEVVACMAGLTRMPVLPFLTALACGSLPMAFTFAAIGSEGVERPVLAIALSALLPLVLWPLAHWLLGRAAGESRER